jgi:hypothetical protein
MPRFLARAGRAGRELTCCHIPAVGLAYVVIAGKQLKHNLEFLVEVARRARDIDSARDAAFTVLDALDDARGFRALGTVSRLRRVHYFLAIASFGNFGHG